MIKKSIIFNYHYLINIILWLQGGPGFNAMTFNQQGNCQCVNFDFVPFKVSLIFGSFFQIWDTKWDHMNMCIIFYFAVGVNAFMQQMQQQG